MLRIQDYLPIGSVVTLKNGTKKLMIFGIIQIITDEKGNSKEYDYIGVPYPEGNMGLEFQYVFNHDEIAQIHFEGFQNIERQEFIYDLSQQSKTQ